MIEIERPRSASELIGATFELYVRLPLLFATLAAGVVVPYWLIVLALTSTGPFTGRHLSFTAGLILWVTQLSLEGPLISALHVHAVDDVNEGRRPTIKSVARRGLKTLPVVSAAVVAATIGSAAGLIALIVPGVILWIRWAVSAQSAALEEGGWIDALKRSTELSRGNYLHIVGTLLLAGVVTVAVGFPLIRIFRFQPTNVGTFAMGVAYQTLATSFFALASALLYFDLRSRTRFVGDREVIDIGSPLPGAPSEAADRPPAEPTGHPLDPASYGDADRPRGWYVDTSDPARMRYWSGDARLGWNPSRSRTPKKTLADWHAYKEANPGPAPTPAGASDRPQVEPTGHPLDPDSYSDEDRPQGWYVVPETPWRMRHWSGDPGIGWSRKTARTPKQTLAGWWKISGR